MTAVAEDDAPVEVPTRRGAVLAIPFAVGGLIGGMVVGFLAALVVEDPVSPPPDVSTLENRVFLVGLVAGLIVGLVVGIGLALARRGGNMSVEPSVATAVTFPLFVVVLAGSILAGLWTFATGPVFGQTSSHRAEHAVLSVISFDHASVSGPKEDFEVVTANVTGEPGFDPSAGVDVDGSSVLPPDSYQDERGRAHWIFAVPDPLKQARACVLDLTQLAPARYQLVIDCDRDDIGPGT